MKKYIMALDQGTTSSRAILFGKNGEMAAGFSKEYRNCGNGYYYLLINDEYMIGYDID